MDDLVDNVYDISSASEMFREMQNEKYKWKQKKLTLLENLKKAEKDRDQRSQEIEHLKDSLLKEVEKLKKIQDRDQESQEIGILKDSLEKELKESQAKIDSLKMEKENLIKAMKDKDREQFLQLQKLSTKSQEIEALQNKKSSLIIKIDSLKKLKNDFKKAKKDRDQQIQFLKNSLKKN